MLNILKCTILLSIAFTLSTLLSETKILNFYGVHAQETEGAPFEVPSSGTIKRQYDFWLEIYTKYSTYHGLLHDSKNVNLVYEVIDLSAVADTGRPAWKSKLVKERKKYWNELLVKLSKKRGDFANLNEEENQLLKKLELNQVDISKPEEIKGLTSRRRMRLQLGQKDRFMDGIIQSGKYLTKMEEIFKNEGLPVEITRLPFVESSFNIRARSKVGASGIWQFMRSTGRLFMHLTPSIDERNDPIRATESAARLMRVNYLRLGFWPLAITAYNHGTEGVARAQRNTRSNDLEDIISDYKSRRFGFASSNFYAEFLAAVEAERNAEKYFGKIERSSSIESSEIPLPAAVYVSSLVDFLKLDLTLLKEFNPGILDAGWKSRAPLPAGYKLRYPMEPNEFLAMFEAIPAKHRRPSPRLKEKLYGSKPKVANNL